MGDSTAKWDDQEHLEYGDMAAIDRAYENLKKKDAKFRAYCDKIVPSVSLPAYQYKKRPYIKKN